MMNTVNFMQLILKIKSSKTCIRKWWYNLNSSIDFIQIRWTITIEYKKEGIKMEMNCKAVLKQIMI